MNSQVDLRQLAVDRTSAGTTTSLTKKSAWLTRWGVPLLIVLGFVGIVGWSARDFWLPAKPVTVTPVVLTKAEIQESGTPLFQSAGWIEPRPTAVMCSALVEGVVDQLLVIEGQEVAAGGAVAKLIDADAQLAVREAKSSLRLREAERDASRAALAAAQKNVDQPVHLQAAHAEAEAGLAAIEAEIRNLPFQIQAAASRLNLAQQDLEGKKSIGDAISGRSLQKSQSEFDSATAALAELKQREPSLKQQLDAWKRKCDALHSKLELKTEEVRALDEARANLVAADVRVEQAKLAVETSELRLDRMTVRSPISGRVLALNAQPGRRLMGINAASERDASTVVTVYDPQKLQVRADVRLEDVPQVQIGQQVQISTAAAGETFVGHVLAMTSQADIQKNTLQVKVGIDQPADVLRPEMLAQVTFLAPEKPGSKSDQQNDPVRLLVARELVESGESGSTIWVFDGQRGVAKRQSIQLGRAGTDQLVEVTQGLSALDKLIVSGREGLSDGARVRVTGDDRTLGTRGASLSGAAATTADANTQTIK